MSESARRQVAVPSGLKPQYDVYPLTPALRLGLVTVLSELGFSPDSAWSSKCRTSTDDPSGRFYKFRLFIVNLL